MGRGSRKDGRGGGGYEDQFGEAMRSQDRQDHSGSAGRGSASAGGGGGDAGGSKRGSNVSFIRQTPKFLQGHVHLLGARTDADVQEQLTAKREMPQWDSDDDEAAEKEDALRRAVAEDASLAEQYPELANMVAKNEAEAEKDKGSKAFNEKRYEEAVRHFSRCIGLEPSNAIYFSNRAAAQTALKNFSGALSDGKEVVRLRPQWAKGWARIAAAQFGLEDFQESREAYEKALELEPNDKGLQEARHRAHVAEHKAMDVHRHKFKRRQLDGLRQQQPGAVKKSQHATVVGSAKAAAGAGNKSKLSFGNDDDDDDAVDN